MNAPEGWDDRAVRAPGGHVMQSAAWARIREAQGWRATFLSSPTAVALLLSRPLPLGGRFAYAPRGPVPAGRSRDSFGAALDLVAGGLRSERAVFAKVDAEVPYEWGDLFRARGWRRGADVQPVLATLELDLAPEEDALFAALEKDTRWSVRQAEKRGVAIREATADPDLRAFYELYAVTGERAGFITRTWDYYRLVWRTLIDAGLATLRLAEHEGAPVAGSMTWHCGDREMYMYGATSEAGRRCHAAYGLLWSSIREARRNGFRRFDLGGIPADLNDQTDTMQGPYRFKKGFGGEVRRFAGAHDLVGSPLRYAVFRVAEPVYTRARQLAGRARG